MEPGTFSQFAHSILLPVALRLFASTLILRPCLSPSCRWIINIYSFGQLLSLPPLALVLARGTTSESWRQIKPVSVVVDILMLMIIGTMLFRSIRDYREDKRHIEIRRVQSKWLDKRNELLDKIGKVADIANAVAKENATESALLDTMTLERAIYIIATMHKTHSWNEIEDALEKYLREQTEKMYRWVWGRNEVNREIWFNEIVARHAVSMMDVDEMKYDYATWWSCVVEFIWTPSRVCGPRPAENIQ